MKGGQLENPHRKRPATGSKGDEDKVTRRSRGPHAARENDRIHTWKTPATQTKQQQTVRRREKHPQKKYNGADKTRPR